MGFGIKQFCRVPGGDECAGLGLNERHKLLSYKSDRVCRVDQCSVAPEALADT